MLFPVLVGLYLSKSPRCDTPFLNWPQLFLFELSHFHQVTLKPSPFDFSLGGVFHTSRHEPKPQGGWPLTLSSNHAPLLCHLELWSLKSLPFFRIISHSHPHPNLLCYYMRRNTSDAQFSSHVWELVRTCQPSSRPKTYCNGFWKVLVDE